MRKFSNKLCYYIRIYKVTVNITIKSFNVLESYEIIESLFKYNFNILI